MSTATKTGQVIFSQKAGVYMVALMCDKGDLYQEYDGEANAPTNIAPDFATLRPTLAFMITSSRVAEGIVVPQKVEWYFNDTKLTFDGGNLSTNSLGGDTGHFKNIPYQAGTTDYYSLQLLKNLVKASAGASCTLKAVATIAVGNTSDTVQFVYTIPITKGVGNQKVVTIISGDDKYFAIREKGGSCILSAMAHMGASELTSGLTYKWYQQAEGTWQEISGQTGKTLTVNESMVDTSGVFKVEVYQSSTLIGMDTQKVIDLSDPYDILTNPNPADETIEAGTGGSVTYTPILVKRGSTTKVKDMKFYFVFMDSAGVILNPSTATTPAATGTCTEAMCQQAGGNVNWTITTEE